MLGQLQDAGNTTTLAHYLDLLKSSGLVMGVPKYAGQRVRQRASSPKLLVLNTALMSASDPDKMAETRQEPDRWGRLVESAVGSSLANGIVGKNIEFFYWSSRNREVDFVLSRKNELIAIEVKSGRNKGSFPGIEAFSKEFKVKRKLLVGSQGISLGEFFLTAPEELF
jgi:predicted AAA+ superfamily ATPase